jgi:ribosome-associated translation inhibitor RaiA
MQIAPEVAFRNVTPTSAMQMAIEEGIEELERVEDRITSCRLVVERPHRRHRSGNPCHVRIDLTLPGAEIVVNRAPPEHGPEEAVAAISEAFRTARMRLLERARKRRSVKRQPDLPEPHAAG